MSQIALVGGNEFRPNCITMDRTVLAAIQKRPVRVLIVPTAAANENPSLAARNGTRYFETLGAQASAARILSNKDANDPGFVNRITQSDLVYFTGGNPRYLLDVLRDTRVWTAIMDFLEAGGTLAGSSAGAMVLGRKMFFHGEWIDALGLLPRVVVFPHHRRQNITGDHPWKGTLGNKLIFGIPEATACLTLNGKTWRIAGERNVAVYSDSDEFHYQSGKEFEVI